MHPIIIAKSKNTESLQKQIDEFLKKLKMDLKIREILRGLTFHSEIHCDSVVISISRIEVGIICMIHKAIAKHLQGLAEFGDLSIDHHSTIDKKSINENEELLNQQEYLRNTDSKSNSSGSVKSQFSRVSNAVSSLTGEELTELRIKSPRQCFGQPFQQDELSSGTIKIVTWNAAGNDRPGRQMTIEAELLDLSKITKADFFFIQECPLRLQFDGYEKVAVSAAHNIGKDNSTNCVIFKKYGLQTGAVCSSKTWDGIGLNASYVWSGLTLISIHVTSGQPVPEKERAIHAAMPDRAFIIGGDFNMCPKELKDNNGERWEIVKSSGETTHLGTEMYPPKEHDFFLCGSPRIREVTPTIIENKFNHGSDHNPVKLQFRICV